MHCAAQTQEERTQDARVQGGSEGGEGTCPGATGKPGCCALPLATGPPRSVPRHTAVPGTLAWGPQGYAEQKRHLRHGLHSCTDRSRLAGLGCRRKLPAPLSWPACCAVLPCLSLPICKKGTVTHRSTEDQLTTAQAPCAQEGLQRAACCACWSCDWLSCREGGSKRIAGPQGQHWGQEPRG